MRELSDTLVTPSNLEANKTIHMCVKASTAY